MVTRFMMFHRLEVDNIYRKLTFCFLFVSFWSFVSLILEVLVTRHKRHNRKRLYDNFKTKEFNKEWT